MAKIESGGPGPGKRAACSFCGRSGRESGPLVEGPRGVYICPDCIQAAQSVVQEEKRRSHRGPAALGRTPTPREIKDFLDLYVCGQEQAKKAVAVAVHNHYKRLSLEDSATEDDVEIEKSNLLRSARRAAARR